MVNPQFLEAKPLGLVDVKGALQKIEERDNELNFQSNKVKEYLDGFVTTSPGKKEQLLRKLAGLQLTRLKEEHIAKIVDFLPTTVPELKVVLQAYPLTLPKKDQESIVQAVAEIAGS